MNSPLVSIVITNHNYGKYLPDAIKSLADQTYDSIEVIFVDDGSTDDSRGVIEGLQKKYEERFERFTTHYLLVNKGINEALNLAISDVQGEITLIFDADDILDPRHLENLISVLLEKSRLDSKVSFSYCDCYLIDEEGEKIQKGLSKEFDPELIESESFLPRPSPIFTSVLKSFFPLETDLPQDPKHLLWKKICREGYKGVYVQEPLFLYRIHDKNFSGIGKKIASAKTSGLLARPLHLSDYWPNS